MSELKYERNKYSFIQRKLNSRSSTEEFRSAYNALEECSKQNYGISLEEKLESLKKEKKESEIWDRLTSKRLESRPTQVPAPNCAWTYLQERR